MKRVWPPMLARLSTPAEASEDTHVFEVKYDGFRALASLSDGRLSLQSRNGKDLCDRFPKLAEALRQVRVGETVVDGEIVALDAQGRSRFQLLQNASGEDQRYVIFDVLWVDGEDVRAQPLEVRRNRLEEVFARAKRPLQVSERVELPLERAMAEARQRGWEGLIAKRKGSPYVGRRSDDWLKLKVIAGQEVVIVGYLPIKNERAETEIGALLVGVHGPDGYQYVGKVGTGFNAKTRRELRTLLDKERVEEPVVLGAKPRPETVWVRPRHVAQVHFTEWTEDGRLRHPVFEGLRTDKRPEDVVREQPAPVEPSQPRRTVARGRTQEAGMAKAERSARGERRAPQRLAARMARAPEVESELVVGQAKLTHGDRVLFPECGYTKADVFAYYREVAPVLVPILTDRPIAVQQWPGGIQTPGFFRQQLSGTPDWVPTMCVRHEGKTLYHVNAKEPETLLWLANQSALTLHMWNSHMPKLAQPDWVVFDLDPGTGGWDSVITLACALRRKLEELELESFPKTSGKRGLHVLIPLAPGHTYAQAQRFADRLSGELAEELPDISTTERTIAKRKGRLYIDAGQNARGKTVVAPYALRGKEGAPFSAPLKWSEVTRRLDPTRFNLKTVRKRLDAVGELFAPALRGKQHLPK
jgi:bifunctional non-homologous end joining protein LigD